jgi:hypothetical protein
MIGYIYVPQNQDLFTGGKVGDTYFTDEKIDLFASAKVGDTIIKPVQKPPYLVVDHVLDKILITKWPGVLYQVEILNPSEEKGINVGLVKNVWYTRTFGVKIIDEIPIEILFGANGIQIKQILDLLKNLTEEQVNQLATYEVAQSQKIYAKAWKQWVSLTDKAYFNATDHYEKVLKAYPKNQNRVSPIGQGLSIIHGIFYQTARKLTQDEALEVDEDGEISLKPTWDRAQTHFLHAGMSYEDLHLLTEAEKKHLRKPIERVFQ